ncbi:MAG: RNA methyltransferase [Lachnospiraceae bacterium]|nr:RNA methyltransferase [Lachnospiraceae bacterium]
MEATISSNQNSQIKQIQNLLKSSKRRQEEGLFVAEGKRLCFDLLENNSEYVKKMYFSSSKADELVPLMPNAALYEVVKDDIFEKVSETDNSQGVLALVKMPEYSVANLFDDQNAKDLKKSTVLLLDGLTDPGNAGTIMRTALATGVKFVAFTGNSVDVYNPKVVRATMGAIFRLPFVYFKDTKEAIDALKEAGYKIASTHLSGDKMFNEIKYPIKCAVVIGNEAHGISDVSKEAADYLVKIPMEPGTESLNAAVAASLMMYKLYLG